MSKHKIVFNVDVRARVGTGGAREARREGFVPGVLYGGDLAPVAINLRKPEVIKAIETGQFLNTTATLVYKGEKQLVIPQGIQMHPVSENPGPDNRPTARIGLMTDELVLAEELGVERGDHAVR
jgi:large subunit ribosomal protein L25